jgi:hypothetical protein
MKLKQRVLLPIFSNQIEREVSSGLPRVIALSVTLPPHSDENGKASKLMEMILKRVGEAKKTNAIVNASKQSAGNL